MISVFASTSPGRQGDSRATFIAADQSCLGRHGDSSTLMMNAPVTATLKVLATAGLTLDDIDLFEVKEAFVVVAEKCTRDLKIDGGSIALGHPIGEALTIERV